MKKYFFIQDLNTFKFFDNYELWTNNPKVAMVFADEVEAEKYLLKNMNEDGYYAIIPNYQ